MKIYLKIYQINSWKWNTFHVKIKNTSYNRHILCSTIANCCVDVRRTQCKYRNCWQWFQNSLLCFFYPSTSNKKRFSHERFLSWQTRDGIFIQRLPEFYYCYIFDRVQVTKVLMDENSFIFLFWQWQILTEFKSIEEIEAFITKITTKITIMFPTDGTFSMNPWKGFAGSFPFR